MVELTFRGVGKYFWVATCTIVRTFAVGSPMTRLSPPTIGPHVVARGIIK